MTRRQLTRRVTALMMVVDPPAQFRFVVISPETWPDEELAAYDDARERGDIDAQNAIIWRVTGQRVSRAALGVHSIRDHAPVRIMEVRSTPEGSP